MFCSVRCAHDQRYQLCQSSIVGESRATEEVSHVSVCVCVCMVTDPMMVGPSLSGYYTVRLIWFCLLTMQSYTYKI